MDSFKLSTMIIKPKKHVGLRQRLEEKLPRISNDRRNSVRQSITTGRTFVKSMRKTASTARRGRAEQNIQADQEERDAYYHPLRKSGRQYALIPRASNGDACGRRRRCIYGDREGPNVGRRHKRRCHCKRRTWGIHPWYQSLKTSRAKEMAGTHMTALLMRKVRETVMMDQTQEEKINQWRTTVTKAREIRIWPNVRKGTVFQYEIVWL